MIRSPLGYVYVMDDKELAALKARVDADDPNAMFIYAQAVRATNPVEADKYILLAAYLGHPNAAELLGDKYNAAGDRDHALHFYKTGAKGGVLDCAVKIAVLNLEIDEYSAMHELEELAESGVTSACAALAAYHKSRGNRKQSAFWHSLIK